MPVLLQFSTFNWFVGGIALLVAVRFFGPEAGLQRVCWWGARICSLLSATSGQAGAGATQAGYSTEQR